MVWCGAACWYSVAPLFGGAVKFTLKALQRQGPWEFCSVHTQLVPWHQAFNVLHRLRPDLLLQPNHVFHRW